MPKAYSYLRFSTPEQMKGDSHRRQSTLAQKYATEHHLDLDDTLTFKDLGVSAFRGKNAEEEGQLGAFLAAVETVYSQASMTMNPMDLMYALMGFIRANDESAHKSMRLKAVWSAKRARADKKPLTSLAPSWLRLDDAALLGSSDRLDALADAYARTWMDPLLKEMQAINAERDELQKRRDELARKAGAVACPLTSKRLQDLEGALKAESLDRRRVNTLMRMVCEGFTVDPDNCGAYLTWKIGGTSEWVFFGFPKDKAKSEVMDTEENPEAAKAA